VIGSSSGFLKVFVRSHVNETRKHEEAPKRLRGEYARIQGRLRAMYLDKLDGRIEADSYDRLAGEWCGWSKTASRKRSSVARQPMSPILKRGSAC
jgi:hypothetical protein